MNTIVEKALMKIKRHNTTQALGLRKNEFDELLLNGDIVDITVESNIVGVDRPMDNFNICESILKYNQNSSSIYQMKINGTNETIIDMFIDMNELFILNNRLYLDYTV